MASKANESTLDALVADCKTPQDVAALYTQMLQRVIDRGLNAELDAHLGYARNDKSDTPRSNTRNGATKKRLKGTFGEVEISTPRDREGGFEPVLVKKRQTRLGDLEDKILALYARGMSTRDIESALVDLYGVTVSHDVIARVGEVRQELRDNAAVLQSLRQRSAAGNGAASYELAGHHHRGEGVPVNYGEAVRLYRLGARQGNAPAQRMLALIVSKSTAAEPLNASWMLELSRLSLPETGTVDADAALPDGHREDPLSGLAQPAPRRDRSGHQRNAGHAAVRRRGGGRHRYAFSAATAAEPAARRKCSARPATCNARAIFASRATVHAERPILFTPATQEPVP